MYLTINREDEEWAQNVFQLQIFSKKTNLLLTIQISHAMPKASISIPLLWNFFFTSGDHVSKSSSVVLGMHHSLDARPFLKTIP